MAAITDRERDTHVVCQRAHRPRRKQVPCAGNEAVGHGISLFLLPILLALASSLIAVSYVEGSERQSVEKRVTQDTGAFRMEDSDAPRATTSKIPGYETTTALRTMGRLKRESTFIKERLRQANTKLEEGKDAKKYTASNDEDGNNNVDTNYEESLNSDEDGMDLDKKTGFLRHYQRLILLRSQQKAAATAHEEQLPFVNITQELVNMHLSQADQAMLNTTPPPHQQRRRLAACPTFTADGNWVIITQDCTMSEQIEILSGQTLKVKSSGATRWKITAASWSRHFLVKSGGDIIIEGLELTGGSQVCD